MTDVKLPKFSFKSTISEEEFKEQTKRVPKYFEPGNYKLEIKEASFHNMSKSDDTWAVYKLLLGAIDGRTIQHYVLVPTQRPEFNPENSRKPLAMFEKFREILAALGEETDIQKINLRLFEKPAKLVGKVLDVDIGFDGFYLQQSGDGSFKVVDRYGKNVKDSNGNIVSGIDREAAFMAAAELGIEIKRFASVIKFHAKPVQAEQDTW